MKLHELKIKEEYFNAILRGDKTFELRKNDRDYQVGDLIHFVEVYRDIAYIGGIPAFDIVRQKTATKEYTREFKGYEKNLFEITYILKGVPEYYCILGFKKVENLLADDWEVVEEKKKVKLRDLTPEQFKTRRRRSKNCKKYDCCKNCPFRMLDCNDTFWLSCKDMFSDNFLDQEIEVEDDD